MGKNIIDVNKAVPQVTISHTEVNKPTYRYVCDGCTGVANISHMPDAFVLITCRVCGKVQHPKKENWIAI